MGESAEPSSRERGPDEAFCRNCGALISDRAEICPECGVRQLPPPKSTLDSAVDDVFAGGNPFVAAALSALFPGLGQLYNRELGKGIAFLVGGILAAMSTLVFVGILLYPAVWVYAIYDAYKVADRGSAGPAAPPTEPTPPAPDGTGHGGDAGDDDARTDARGDDAASRD